MGPSWPCAVDSDLDAFGGSREPSTDEPTYERTKTAAHPRVDRRVFTEKILSFFLIYWISTLPTASPESDVVPAPIAPIAVAWPFAKLMP